MGIDASLSAGLIRDEEPAQKAVKGDFESGY